MPVELLLQADTATTSVSPLLTSIIALLGVVLGAIIAAIATWRMSVLSVAATFESEKYKQRLASYQALWSRTQRLRRTPEAADLSLKAMHETLDNLDSWYFQTGGLLLTDEARQAYFGLVRAIQSLPSTPNGTLSAKQYMPVFTAATTLRDVTATEVRGRTGTPFGIRSKPAGVSTQDTF